MPRSSFHGTRQILSFNAPFYALSVAAIGAAWVFSRFQPRGIVRIGAQIGAALGAFWTLASIAASWWVYDFSGLMKWRWLEDFFEQKPKRWANFHAGLDEATPILNQIFGDGEVFDFYDEKTMTEPSIHRARRLFECEIAPQAADFRALPMENEVLDAAFVLFSAHEIRDARDRESFFAQLHRVLALGGRLIVVEHVRDAANFAVFGPGALHFWSAAEWERLARPGFALRHARKFTPFARVWVWEKEKL